MSHACISDWIMLSWARARANNMVEGGGGHPPTSEASYHAKTSELDLIVNRMSRHERPDAQVADEKSRAILLHLRPQVEDELGPQATLIDVDGVLEIGGAGKARSRGTPVRVDRQHVR